MEIPLANRRGEIVAVALVDPEDHPILMQWRWCRYADGYAGRRTPAGMLLMHRQIMGLQPGDPREVDHRNRITLDNHRSNLRIVTHAEQQQNLPAMGGTSRFRGVSWDAKNGKWRATVILDGKQHSCGRHADEVDAALAAEAFRRERMPFALPDPLLAEVQTSAH